MGALNNSDIWRMLKIDFERAFLSVRFALSVAIGVSVCYITLLFCGHPGPTIYMFVYMHDRSLIFLALIAGVLPYSACFYEDFLHGNIRNVLGRVDVGGYVFSKSAAAVASSVAAFLMGKLIFIILYSIRHPVCLPGVLDALPGTMLYKGFIEEEQYMIYFLLVSLQKALYCGVLCQAVLLVSVWLQNLSIMFSVPLAVFYVVNFHFRNITDIACLNLARIFDGVTRIWMTDIQNFMYALMAAMLLYLLLFRTTLWSIRRKIYHV